MTTRDFFLLSLTILVGCTTTQDLGTRIDGGGDDSGGAIPEVDAGTGTGSRDGAIGNETDTSRDCIDECADGESVCDGPRGYRVCGDFDADPCREWSGTTACEEGQSCNASGVCAPGPCSDQCTRGATQCRGSAIVTCGDQNEDGCTEWSPSAGCATGTTCQAGACQPIESCEDECTANECVGNTFHECGQFDADPCLDRSSGLSCTPADLCLEGACSPTMGCMSTAQICDGPPAQTCVNANTLRVYDAVGECTAGDCSYAPRDVVCPNCPSCDACAGVTCDMPPAATCASAGVRRTFESSGTCEAGSCNYTSIDTACNTPPAATCVDANTARTYAVTGICAGGTCTYAAVDTPCLLGCAEGSCNPHVCESESTCLTGDGCCPLGCSRGNDGDCSGRAILPCDGIQVPGDYATIGAALVAVDSGRTATNVICLGPNTFVEDINVPNLSRSVVLRGASADTTRVEGDVRIGSRSHLALLELGGFTVDGNVSLQLDADVHDMTLHGLLLRSSEYIMNVVIARCDLSATGTALIAELLSSGSLHVTVESSFVHDAATGISATAGGLRTDRLEPRTTLVLRGNSFVTNAEAVRVRGGYLAGEYSITYFDNLFLDSSVVAVDLEDRRESTARHGRNAFFGNGMNFGGAAGPGVGDVRTDPLLDRTESPPRPMMGSPMIGGASSSAPERDYWGLARDSMPDIGAVEHR